MAKKRSNRTFMELKWGIYVSFWSVRAASSNRTFMELK